MCTPGPYSCAAPNAGVSPGYFCQRHRSFVRTPLGGPDETQPPQVTILPAGGACGASVGDRDRDGARQLVQPLTGAQPGISATPGVDPHAGHQHEEPAGGWAGRCGAVRRELTRLLVARCSRAGRPPGRSPREPQSSGSSCVSGLLRSPGARRPGAALGDGGAELLELAHIRRVLGALCRRGVRFALGRLE